MSLSSSSNGPSAWGRMISKITKTDNVLNAPDGYNSAVLAEPFYGGSAGEHCVRMKFVSGNTILIGFTQ